MRRCAARRADGQAAAVLRPQAPAGNSNLHGDVGGMTRLQYFAVYGGDGVNGIGTKAAMVGWLLAEAFTSDVGTFALSNDAYLNAMAAGGSSYASVDVIGHYNQPGFAYHG
jgi:hypothetical protein